MVERFKIFRPVLPSGLALLLVCLSFGTASALDPMRIRIRTALPSKIETVGQAAQYFADAIGYRLVTRSPAPEESSAIAGENLNPLAMTNGVLPVEEAILSVLRRNCMLVIDKDHKLFSFERGGERP